MAKRRHLGRITKSLDGRWRFAPLEQAMWGLSWQKPRLKGGLCEGLPFVTRGVTVPHAWNDGSDPEFNLYRGAAIYIKDFTLPKSFKGRRAILRFGAVNYKCDVYLDGADVGTHEGGYTPFEFDITERVKPGGGDRRHRLVVLVDNARSEQTFPALSADWESYGGIHRPVEIVGVPKVHLGKVLAFPTLGANGRGELKVKVTVEGLTGRPRICDLSLELRGKGLRIADRERVKIAGSGAPVTFALKGLDVKPWTAEAPAMYDLTVTLDGDRVTKRVGFRRIEVNGGRLLLNGKPIMLRGVCKHEDHPDHGPCLPESQLRADVELMKRTNCNAVRLAHYPHQERIYELCDEAGLLVWAEIPFVGGDVHTGDVKARLGVLKGMLTELIERDCHHPSVILWSVGNEVASSDPAGKKFLGELFRHARKLDPTRLVTMASNRGTAEITSQAYADVAGVNEYYGWYSPDLGRLPKALDAIHRTLKMPIIISEFGAPAVRGRKGTPSERWSERHQEKVFKGQLKALTSKSYIVGMFPWNLIDFRSLRRANTAQGGYNRKGVTDEYRRPKLAWKVLRDVYGRMAKKAEKANRRR